MKKIAVLLETDGNGVKESVFAALSLAAQSGPVTALVSQNAADAAALVEQCSRYGVERIIAVVAPGDAAAQPDLRAAALADCIRAEGVTDLVAVHSMEGKDILARLAVLLNAAFAGDCLAIDFAARTVKKSYFAGKAAATLSMPSPVAVYGLRPNALEAVPTPASPTIQEFVSSAQAPAGGITILETQGDDSASADLSEAPIVVSGGKAMGSAENFDILHALANKLDGAVGASRAAVDAGYAPHVMQVGQTGKTVSPNLYLACGVSGAVQHYAGIKTAKIIVAINNDKDAPIFSKCNYGIVGDLFDVVPELTKALS